MREAEAEQAALSSKQRFAVMDGLRGVAALAVVLFHSFYGGGIFPNGQLAVDLFFILSGFVIGYSYDERLTARGATGRFLLSRFIRLYPMLFMGALGGICFALVHNLTNPADADALKDIAISGGLSLLALPYLGPAVSDGVFSFNPPIWSLFFEILANLVYAIFARWLSVRVLLVVVVVAVVSVMVFGPLGGNEKALVYTGVPRVAAGFFGGLLLYKLWRSGRLPNLGAGIVPLSAAMLLIFALPVAIGGWTYLPTFVALMAIVTLAANSRPASTDGWCEFLGLISYPIYLVHWLTLYAFAFVGAKLGLSGGLYVVIAVAHLAAMPIVGYLVARFYETPVRLFLAHRLKGGGATATA